MMKGNRQGSPRVFLVDDQVLLLEALCLALTQSGHTEVAGCARSAEEAEIEIGKAQADIALIDVVLPGRSGVDLAKWALEQIPTIKVIWMSHSGDEDLFTLGKGFGVSGFISKRDTLANFERSILSVLAGRSVWPSHSARMFRISPVPPEQFGLSGRKYDLLLAITSGLSTKEIAAKLGISTRTAEEYRSEVCGLLKVHSVAELVKICIRNGWVQP